MGSKRPLELPGCRCAEDSEWGRVFTCPVCVQAALRFHRGERVDQLEAFEYVDREISVSGLLEGEGVVSPSKESRPNEAGSFGRSFWC